MHSIWSHFRSRNRSAIFLLHLSLLLSAILFTGTAWAQTIAFIPLLALTRDSNGINNPVTERVRQELVNRNKTLVPAEKVMRFLIRNRIRQLGKLTSYQASLVRKELQADLVLQGTLYQINTGELPLLCLTLQLSRTEDSKIIWSQTANLSYADQINLLGLDDPHGIEDLYAPFFEQLFASMPTSESTAGEATTSLNIDTIFIHPQYLRPGEEISCRVKIHKSIDEQGSMPELSVQVGDQHYPLTSNEGEYSYSTSWKAGGEAGTYTVNLLARWPSGISRESVIGIYSIDTEEPGVRLTLLGTELNGEILFSRNLRILPKLIKPEPISHWAISVTDEDEDVIVLIDKTGNLPRSLTWNGRTSYGTTADPGGYLITFRAWDRAERESSTEAWVQYLPELPEMTVEISREDPQIRVDLDYFTETPLIFWWAKFFKEDGSLLKLAQGTELPASIELDLANDSRDKIQCLLTARDILGNQYKKRIRDLFEMAEGEIEEIETSIETEWVEEF